MSRKKTLPALLLAALGLLLLAAPAAADMLPTGDERILYFLSDAAIQKDTTLEVTETIRIRAAGDRFVHGLLRDFPTRYKRDGRTIRVGFHVLSVERDGHKEPYDTEGIDNGTRVKIGDADKTLDPGEHVYVLRYRTNHQLGFFPRYDELYWNATGTGWDFPIDVAEARVRLPAPAAFGQRAFYTGAQGSKDANAEVVEEKPGEILFRTTAPLAAHEGLTIAASFPKGIVDAPKPPTAAQQWLADKGPFAAAGLAIAALCFFYFQAWKKAGRGPVAGTIVPLFTPPQGLSAAAIRYVRRMGYDNRAFAAALIESGVHGKLRLVEEKHGFFSGKETVIEKTAEPGGMPAPEQAMLSALFAGGDTLEMDDKNHETFSAAQKGLREGLQAAYLDKTFHTNKGWAWAGLALLLAALLFVVLSIALTDPYADKDGWFGPALGLLLAVGGVAAGLRSRLAGPGRSWLLAALSIALLAVAAVLLLASLELAADPWQMVAVAAPLLTLPLVLSAFAWMAAPTAEGRRLMDQIAGFERYLSVTEENRLDTLHPPEKTPELFERYLPHAIALEVENRWADKFEDVLEAASADPSRQQGMAWYSGSTNPWSNPGRFASAVGGALTSSVASASTAPGSSSGSGGGGSSGGGGGGGGGGGW